MKTTTERLHYNAEGVARIRADIERHLNSWNFKYITLDDAEVLCHVSIGMHGWVAVIGNPGWGTYEWVAREEPDAAGQMGKLHHSDCGYGSSSVALRDVLNKFCD